MRPELDIRAQLPTLSVTAACTIAAVALAVAMGIGRFAFTPLLPLMLRDGSLPQSAGAWLAASNYAGYLVGALTASRLPLSLPTLMRVSLAGTAASTAAMGAFDGLGSLDRPARHRRRAQRLDAGRDQRVGVAASGAGGARRSLRHGVCGRRAWDCVCRAVLPCGRASRRAGKPALAGARGGGGAGNRCSQLSCGEAVGGLGCSRFGTTGQPHDGSLQGPRDLLRRARVRLHPARHVPSRSRPRGRGQPADVRAGLARVRPCCRAVHHRNGAAVRWRQPAAGLGRQPSCHGHRCRPAEPVAHSGDDCDCSPVVSAAPSWS